MVEKGSWHPDGAQGARWARMHVQFGDARLDRVGAVAAVCAAVTGVGMGFVSLAVPMSDPAAVSRFVGLEVVLAVLWPFAPACAGAALGLDPGRRAVLGLLGGVALALAARSVAAADPVVPSLVVAGVSTLTMGAAWMVVAWWMTTTVHRATWAVVSGMHGVTGLVLVGVAHLAGRAGDDLVLAAGAFVWLGLAQAATIAIRAQVAD